VPAQPDWAGHPQLRMLELEWQRAGASLLAGSPAAAPWNLGIMGRELRSPGFTDQQVGLSLQVPLSAGGKSAATRSALAALQRDYLIQRDQLQAELHASWRSLKADSIALAARAKQAASLSGEELETLLQATRDSRELAIEIKVARLRSLLAAQAEAALTAARLAAAKASLRQLAGESL